MKSKSQIVATIGPASQDKETIKEMIDHGMDIARLNFSWGNHESHLGYIQNIRAAAEVAGRKIPIIQDLSGPRIQESAGHKFNEETIELLTEKDLADLKFGLENNIEYVAMSYVGKAEDVFKLKAEIARLGKNTPVISKIERRLAIENLDEIIEASNGVMVARGDLGNEVPLEQIPFVQKNIIEKCRLAGKPVITATQMLLSMTENEMPTRAEVTDVAFAIICGSDATMLSEETANGRNPIQAVDIMEKTILEAEKYLGEVAVNQF